MVIFSAQSGHSQWWRRRALKALSLRKEGTGWTCFIAMLNFPLPLRNNLSLISSIQLKQNYIIKANGNSILLFSNMSGATCNLLMCVSQFWQNVGGMQAGWYGNFYCVALCTLRFVFCTLHFALSTLRYALCTLRFALCILHFALCTLHFDPLYYIIYNAMYVGFLQCSPIY